MKRILPILFIINISIFSISAQTETLTNAEIIAMSDTEEKLNGDFSVQISFVHFSLLTHRYVFRVFDRRGGLLISAGQTTSSGSLPHNMAESITKSLTKVLENRK